MTWRAICTPGDSSGKTHLSDSGIEQGQEILPRGTFLAEFDAVASGDTNLIHFSSGGVWNLVFSVNIDSAGVLTLSLSQRQGALNARTEVLPDALQEGLRLWFSWDAPSREAMFAAEALNSGASTAAITGPSFPLPLGDVSRMTLQMEASNSASPMTFFGVSDELLLVGAVPGLTGDVPIETPDGMYPIKNLKPGDMIETEDHGTLPIRAVRTLEVPAHGQFQPLRLCAPYFELVQDIVVAPHLKLLIGGDMVEYLFGEEEVFVGAGQLLDGKSALKEVDYQTIRYYQIVLDEHEILNAGGAKVESLFLPYGDANKQLNDKFGVSHLETARLVLKPYEALTLRSARYQ